MTCAHTKEETHSARKRLFVFIVLMMRQHSVVHPAFCTNTSLILKHCHRKPRHTAGVLGLTSQNVLTFPFLIVFHHPLFQGGSCGKSFERRCDVFFSWDNRTTNFWGNENSFIYWKRNSKTENALHSMKQQDKQQHSKVLK